VDIFQTVDYMVSVGPLFTFTQHNTIMPETLKKAIGKTLIESTTYVTS
jgi:hypothetical protein